MKSLLSRMILSSLLMVLFIPGQSQSATERRTALIIGNGEYSTGRLKNPVNDAADMAAALQKLGFTVILKKNAGLQTMEEALEDFGNRLKRGGVGLFYYAGHGVQVSGVNYLVPVDSKINKESDVRFKALDAGRVLAEMENANNGLNIVLLDACRDNPFGKRFRSASRGLAIVGNAPTGTFISYSTGPGEVAQDGKGRNSPYTKALLAYMREPDLAITDVFMKVRQELRKQTGQVPWELSSLEGKFIFNPRKAGYSTPTEVAANEPASSTDELDAMKREIEAEKEKLRQEKELMEQKRALEEEKRRLEEEKRKLAYVPAAPEPSSSRGYIRAINGNVKEVVFFESGFDPPDKKDRVYRKNFSRTQTRFINWELRCELPAPGRRIDFAIEAIWYSGDNEIWRHRTNSYVLADWTESWHNYSFGWKEVSNNTWKAGNYRVDFYADGEKIASGTFSIY